MIYCPVIDYEFRDGVKPGDVEKLCVHNQGGRCTYWKNESGECKAEVSGG
jgi:hypothetical protein